MCKIVQLVDDFTHKAEIDSNRQLGRLLLTGSANVLMLPEIADSLAGRMEVLLESILFWLDSKNFDLAF